MAAGNVGQELKQLISMMDEDEAAEAVVESAKRAVRRNASNANKESNC